MYTFSLTIKICLKVLNYQNYRELIFIAIIFGEIFTGFFEKSSNLKSLIELKLF